MSSSASGWILNTSAIDPQLGFAAEADDVDPQHRPVAEHFLELLRVVDVLLDDAFLAVGHHADGRRRGIVRDRKRARLRAGSRLLTDARLEPAAIAAMVGHGGDCNGTGFCATVPGTALRNRLPLIRCRVFYRPL